MRIRKIQPQRGYWGDEDHGIQVRLWGEVTEQDTIKVSYLAGGYEHFEFVPINEITRYPQGAQI